MTDQPPSAPTPAATCPEEGNCGATTRAESAPAAASSALAEKNPAPILLYEKSLAGRICEPVETFGAELERLIQILYDTLGEAGGVGLAAPQIGAFDRICIIHHPDCRLVMVNPEIREKKDRNLDSEACLSLPGAKPNGKVVYNRAPVWRFETLVVGWRTPEGEEAEDRFRDMPARIIQHEVDHLDGMFFIDHAKNVARNRVLERLENFRRKMTRQ